MRRIKHLYLFSMILVAFPVCGQTNVTTAAPTTAGTVPVFGPSSSSTVSNSVITQSGNNVGIGTTNPVTTLQVAGALTLPWNGNASTMIQTDGGSGWGSNRYNSIVETGWNSTIGDYLQLTSSGNSLPSNHLGLYIAQAGFYWGAATITSSLPTNPLMTLTGNGSLGIGTTSPGAKFELNGNMKLTSGSGTSITFADGTQQVTAWTGVLCGGDYAEAVETTEFKAKYEPGDVLVISADAEGKVQKSTESYATNVSGIYATKPGVVGKRESLAKVSDDIPMAMVGIVPTKVSAENGAIHPGDLLVTSSRVGYAMKGTDRTRMLGAVIGKAMGTLQKGSGTIEVLVTLQ